MGATNKANVAACGHRLVRRHAGVMMDALSKIRNAAAVSSTHQFQLGTPQDSSAVARHYAAQICPRQRMPLQMLRKVRLSKRLSSVRVCANSLRCDEQALSTGMLIHDFAMSIIDARSAPRMAVSRARSEQGLGARKVLCLEPLQFF